MPIYANPSYFFFPSNVETSNDDDTQTTDLTEEPPGDANENLIFELHVSFKKKKEIN